MESLDYVLIADPSITAEGDCTPTKGSLWLQGRSEMQCFYLVKPQSQDCDDTNLQSV